MLVITTTFILKIIALAYFLWLFIMKKVNNFTVNSLYFHTQITSHITDLMLVILQHLFWKYIIWHIFYDYYYETKLITLL